MNCCRLHVAHWRFPTTKQVMWQMWAHWPLRLSYSSQAFFHQTHHIFLLFSSFTWPSSNSEYFRRAPSTCATDSFKVSQRVLDVSQGRYLTLADRGHLQGSVSSAAFWLIVSAVHFWSSHWCWAMISTSGYLSLLLVGWECCARPLKGAG